MTREEAVEKLKVFAPMVVDDTREALDMAIEALQAEPVKHGKWKYYNYSDINNPYVGLYECTVCKQHEHIKHKFCPNCGAKMDKD